MSFRDRHDRARAPLAPGRLLTPRVAAGVAATAALSYGLGLGLARATRYAEDVEEEAYCRPALTEH